MNEEEKENEPNWLWLCVTVAMPSSSVFAVSTRSYVVITFASPSRCVVTMTQPLHFYGVAR